METQKNIPKGHLTESFVNHAADMLSSYLWLGEVHSMKLYMNILKEVMDVKPELWASIPERNRDRIKLISEALKNNEIPNPWGLKQVPIDDDDDEKQKEIPLENLKDDEIEKIQKDNMQKEKYLNKIINTTYESIEYLTKDKDKLIVSSEMKVRYGRADIMARGPKTCHVIELKLKEADHRIVGQIMKYMRSVGGKLHYGLYEQINGITLAQGYTENALIDLKTIGVKPYIYKFLRNKIILSEV